MDLELRVADHDDVASLVGLINRAYRVEEFFVSGDRTDAARVTRELGTGVFVLAEQVETAEDGRRTRPVGCIYYEIRERLGYFGLLSVDPEAQGGGIGRRLVARAEEDCRQAGCAGMEILVVNLRRELPPWYERLGYRQIGNRPFPDTERMLLPCHFLVMCKDFTAGT